MNTLRMTRWTPTLTAFAVAALVCAPLVQTAVRAQGPPPGGGFGGPGGPGGGGGGFNRRPPFALGTVSAVDSGAGTITITLQFGGGSQTIQTQGTTQIVTQSTAAVSDLKKGDKIEVQGVPTGITASALTIGDSPFAGFGGPGGGFGGPGGGPGAPPPPGGGAPPSANGQAAALATASATGTVTSTSPLTIALSDSASLTLKMAANAKVTKYSTVALSAVKVGDKIIGQGQANDDGTFAATMVAVNVDMTSLPGMGRRGMGQRRGGGFGGGGFAGGGGFGGGGGGFGGGGPQGPPPPQ